MRPLGRKMVESTELTLPALSPLVNDAIRPTPTALLSVNSIARAAIRESKDRPARFATLIREEGGRAVLRTAGHAPNKTEPMPPENRN